MVVGHATTKVLDTKYMLAIRNKDYVLEPLCCKKWQKNPCQEIGLGNMGRLKVLNDTNLVLNESE